MLRTIDVSKAGPWLAAVLVLATADLGRAQSAGEVLYMRYCASCHGVDGRGGGPVAGALQPPPTDLSGLDTGEAQLMKQIDGRRTIRAHGTSAMPVWGEVFEQSLIVDQYRRRTTLQRVQSLADYVRGLQRATPPTP